VGGDFYDLFPVDDSRWVLMIGDVSGSGPAAAALTAQVRHGARVAARAGLDPAAVVSAVNATLDETTGSEWFCTMVYTELVPHRDGIDLQVICAGHVPPLVVRNGVVEELESQAPLLGVLPEASFASRRLRLAPGHVLVMLTDGATEARRHGEHGPEAFFGEDRVLEVVTKAADLDAQGIVDALAGAVIDHTGGQLDDDLAVVALRALPVALPGR
jgi:sigma-B regulation protein RsbU (phosphoserine phosphatase)